MMIHHYSTVPETKIYVKMYQSSITTPCSLALLPNHERQCIHTLFGYLMAISL